MKKAILLVCVMNFTAFGSIFGTIYAELGQEVFIKLLVPCAIIFGTNIATMLSYLGDKTSRRKKTGDDSAS